MINFSSSLAVTRTFVPLTVVACVLLASLAECQATKPDMTLDFAPCFSHETTPDGHGLVCNAYYDTPHENEDFFTTPNMEDCRALVEGIRSHAQTDADGMVTFTDLPLDWSGGWAHGNCMVAPFVYGDSGGKYNYKVKLDQLLEWLNSEIGRNPCIQTGMLISVNASYIWKFDPVTRAGST